MSIADQTFQESVQALANWRQFLALKREEYIRQLERARSAVQESETEGGPNGVPEEPEQAPALDLEAWEVVPIPEPAPNLGPDLNVWDIPGESVLPDEAEIFQLDDRPAPAVPEKPGDNGHDHAPTSQNPALADLGIASSGLPWSMDLETPASQETPEDRDLPDWL